MAAWNIRRFEMKKDDWSFPAKIDKRGRLQIPKKILEMIENDGDRDKMFITTIEKKE
jgi:hypothetical protein